MSVVGRSVVPRVHRCENGLAHRGGKFGGRGGPVARVVRGPGGRKESAAVDPGLLGHQDGAVKQQGGGWWVVVVRGNGCNRADGKEFIRGETDRMVDGKEFIRAGSGLVIPCIPLLSSLPPSLPLSLFLSLIPHCSRSVVFDGKTRRVPTHGEDTVNTRCFHSGKYDTGGRCVCVGGGVLYGPSKRVINPNLHYYVT